MATRLVLFSLVVQLANSQFVDNADLASVFSGRGRKVSVSPFVVDNPPFSELDGIFWPKFHFQNRNISLSENTKPGTRVVEIRALHPLLLRLEYQCFHKKFTCITQGLIGGSWQLQVFLSTALDREETSVEYIQFTVWMFDKDESGFDIKVPYENRNLTIDIEVLDVNDNPPEFSSEGFTINVEKGLDVGTMIKTELSVTDRDIGPNGNIAVVCNFDLTINDGCNAFTILTMPVNISDSSVASPTFKVVLMVEEPASNAESGTSFPLYLEASDSPLDTTEQLTTDSLILINIIEPVTTTELTTTKEPDYVTFKFGSYNVTVEDGTSDGSDPESKVRLVFWTSLIGVEPSVTVKQDPMNWWKVEKSPKKIQSDPDGYEVVVSLDDSASVSRDQPGVSESGTYTFSVQAVVDAIAASSKVTMQIVDRSTTTAQPTTTTQPETTTTITTTTAPTTTTEPSTTIPDFTHVELWLERIDNSDSSVFTVSEDSKNGEPIKGFKLRVLAPKNSQKTVVSLKIWDESGTSGKAFRIVPEEIQADGSLAYLLISDDALLDYEASPTSFNFSISAWIKGYDEPSGSVEVSVVKTDVDDSVPTFQNRSAVFSVPENSLTGTSVGSISAVDADMGQTEELVYDLVGIGSERFAVHKGDITVACPTSAPCLDREKTPVYDLLITATDPDGMTSIPAEVTINIGDRNDNGPRIKASSDRVLIVKGQIRYPVLITVSDLDGEGFDGVSVSLKGDAKEFLVLNHLSRNRYSLSLSDLPAEGTYDLWVVANDKSEQFRDAELKLRVDVQGAVSNVHFKKPQYDRTIANRKLRKGNQLLRLELTGHIAGPVEFYMVKGNPGWLTLDSNSGLVSMGDVPVEGVPGGKYIITVAAVDKETKKQLAIALFSLTILGTRPRSVFPKKLYTASIRKDSETGTEIINLEPEDEFQVEMIERSLEAFDGKMKAVKTAKDLLIVRPSGSVVLGRSIKNSSVTVLYFTVAQTENKVDTASVVVYLETEPKKLQKMMEKMASPVFNTPWGIGRDVVSLSLQEEVEPGYVLAVVSATNPITGEDMRNLSISGIFSDYFHYNDANGQLSLQKKFDYESLLSNETTFNLTLTAGEKPYWTNAVLNITILDLDDNPPLIESTGNDTSNFHVVISENLPPQELVLELRVTDADKNFGVRRVTYTYVLSGRGSDNFQLLRLTEELVALVTSPTVDLDFEKQRSFSLLLSVTDSGENTASAEITVDLMDENDHSPEFLKPRYSAEVVENWPIGATVVKVSATDKDSAENARITYSLDTVSGQDFFSVDKQTGEVKTVRALLNKARNYPYVVRIVAVDHGDVPGSASVDVSIMVEEAGARQENLGLHFTHPPLDELIVIEENNKIGEKIAVAKAVNKDTVAHVVLAYSLTGNGDEKYFAVNSGGEIFVAESLDREKQQHYSVSEGSASSIQWSQASCIVFLP